MYAWMHGCMDAWMHGLLVNKALGRALVRKEDRMYRAFRESLRNISRGPGRRLS